jgi:UDP-3-O-[3-hydroxymyristoyl] glucosamine N-acyltransferase
MTIDEIVRLVNGTLQGDGSREIHDVASIESAGPNDLTFAEGARGLAKAAASRAGCILVPEGVSLTRLTTVSVPRPKLSFIQIATVLRPRPAAKPGIHPTVVVDPQAKLAEDVCAGPQVVIDGGVAVGPGTQLGAGVFLGEGVTVGSQCVFYPRVTVYPGARIGNRVVLHAGVVVGSDGFGYVFAQGQHHKFPQLGGVIIEDDVEIGTNSTVDRGSLGTTVIGRGTKIDNLVQIAHNVKIGHHCVIAAQTGISGSVEIGNYVVLGGQVGVADNVRIEDSVIVGAQAGIPSGKALRKGIKYWGTPARPLPEFKKMYGHLSHLPTLAAKIKGLERGRPEVSSIPFEAKGSTSGECP